MAVLTVESYIDVLTVVEQKNTCLVGDNTSILDVGKCVSLGTLMPQWIRKIPFRTGGFSTLMAEICRLEWVAWLGD